MSESKSEDILCGRELEGNLVEKFVGEIGHQFKTPWETVAFQSLSTLCTAAISCPVSSLLALLQPTHTMALHSQSRPEPMNATPHHSKVKVSVTLSDSFYIAGHAVTGKMELESRADKGLGLGIIMVELVAIEGCICSLYPLTVPSS